MSIETRAVGNENTVSPTTGPENATPTGCVAWCLRVLGFLSIVTIMISYNVSQEVAEAIVAIGVLCLVAIVYVAQRILSSNPRTPDGTTVADVHPVGVEHELVPQSLVEAHHQRDPLWDRQIDG